MNTTQEKTELLNSLMDEIHPFLQMQDSKEFLELSLKILEYKGYFLKEIKEPTIEMCLRAVQQTGYAIQFVKDQTHELCLEAIKQTPYAIEYVRKQTPELCIEAVKQEAYVLKSHIKNPTEEVCIEAVKSDISSLYYIPKEFVTHSLISVGIKNYLALKEQIRSTPITNNIDLAISFSRCTSRLLCAFFEKHNSCLSVDDKIRKRDYLIIHRYFEYFHDGFKKIKECFSDKRAYIEEKDNISYYLQSFMELTFELANALDLNQEKGLILPNYNHTFKTNWVINFKEKVKEDYHFFIKLFLLKVFETSYFFNKDIFEYTKNIKYCYDKEVSVLNNKVNHLNCKVELLTEKVIELNEIWYSNHKVIKSKTRKTSIRGIKIRVGGLGGCRLLSYQKKDEGIAFDIDSSYYS